MSSEKKITLEKFLGSGTKWEPSERDSTKGANFAKYLFQQS